MQQHDSDPLFGDDVFCLLRDDSLLRRIGSSNFSQLIDSPDTPQFDDALQQQHQQQHQQHQQLQHPEHLTFGSQVIVNASASTARQTQEQEAPPGQELSQAQLQQQIGVGWEVMVENTNMISSSHGGQLDEPRTHLENGSASYLADSTPASTVPSVQPWPGRYSFSVSVPTDNKDRNKWCYSQTLKKLYVCPNVAIPVNVLLREWQDASITITPVFKDSRFRIEPVTRCYNCKCTQADPVVAEHIIQIEGEDCSYSCLHERYVVKVPLHPPPPGETVTTLLVKIMCLTSCVGGPNRRPFSLVFTLRNNTGVEIGRQILDVKCCKCPSRDMVNEDKGQQNSLASTALPTHEDQKRKMQKLASEIKVGQKRKRPNIKLEPGTVSGGVNLLVPVRFLSRVKHYINTLELLEICSQVHPSTLSFPEEEQHH